MWTYYVLKIKIKTKCVASLLAQWWRVRLQGTQFRPPSGKTPHPEAAKAVGSNYRAGAPEPGATGLSPRVPEPRPTARGDTAATEEPAQQGRPSTNKTEQIQQSGDDCLQIYRSHPESQTARRRGRAGPRPPGCGLCLNHGVFVGSLFLTTNVSLLFSSGLRIILSKQKFQTETQALSRNYLETSF